MASFMSCSLRTSTSTTERYLVASLHTSSKNRPSRPRKSAAPSRTRLVKDLKPRSGSSGRFEVAPKPTRNRAEDEDVFAYKQPRRRSRSYKSNEADIPPRSAFSRDSLPHEGVAPAMESSGRPLRSSTETLKGMPPISTPSPALSVKQWAARAHAERTQRRVIERRRPRPAVDPLGNEFNTSKLEPTDELPDRFTSPPLLEGLLTSLQEILPPNAKPTPIQALSLKHLFKPKVSDDAWRQYLLASETGSGKSIAYLLPLLHHLKASQYDPRPPQQKRSMNPRGLILAPTHELSRQLSTFAKSLLHITKLRVVCASRPNHPGAPQNSSTASKMATMSYDVGGEGEASSEFEVREGEWPRPVERRPVDLLVGTPNKILEMARGRGWNWEERAREKMEREAPVQVRNFVDAPTKRTFWTAEPEMGLAGIEWVVVDEADVLLDHDFQESTRRLLSDIALARGHSVPFEPDLVLADPETPPTPVRYPFNLLLTTATIPSSLASYLDNYHPDLTRLASPNLHRLPRSLKTEYVYWSGGKRNSDIESRIRRVWAEDSLRGKGGQIGLLSKVLVFCNKRDKVEDLAAFLEKRNIRNVALTGTADTRKRGSNHHLDGFLKTKTKALSAYSADASSWSAVAKASAELKDPKKTPHVLITTSLLSRGLDFSPDIKHVFMIDEPRNMIDFLHRAGRSGRAGEIGKVVIFGKKWGPGSYLSKVTRMKVKALRV